MLAINFFCCCFIYVLLVCNLLYVVLSAYVCLYVSAIILYVYAVLNTCVSFSIVETACFAIALMYFRNIF